MRISNPQNIFGDKLLSDKDAPLGKKIVDCSQESPESFSNGKVYYYDASSKTSVTIPEVQRQENFIVVAEVWIKVGGSIPSFNWPSGSTIGVDVQTLQSNKTHCFIIKRPYIEGVIDKTIIELEHSF